MAKGCTTCRQKNVFVGCRQKALINKAGFVEFFSTAGEIFLTEKNLLPSGLYLLMQAIYFSNHARLRCAQRGIDEALVHMVLAYGRAVYDHRGTRRCFLGRAEKRRLAREAPEIWRQYGRKLDLVVVMPAKGCQQVVPAFVRNRLR